jgi:hypothetical protein
MMEDPAVRPFPPGLSRAAVAAVARAPGFSRLLSRDLGAVGQACALVALCAVMMAPLMLVDVPPLLDYPNHLARAYVLAQGADNPWLSRMYVPHWAVIPNLAVDLILPPIIRLLPVHVAGRLLLALSMLLPVLGIVLYSRALFGRWSWWPLAGVLVGCNGLFLLGFMNFQLAIGLALVFAAFWVLWREARPRLVTCLGTLAAIVLFFSHLMGLAFFLVLAGAHQLEQLHEDYRRGQSLLRALPRRTFWALPVLAAPLALYFASGFRAEDGPALWAGGTEKLMHGMMALVNYDLALDIGTAALLAAFLLGCARLRVLRAKPQSLIALAAFATLWLATPVGFKGTGFIDARFAVMFGFMLFAGLRPARLPPRVAMGVAAAVLLVFGLRTAKLASEWIGRNDDLAQLRDAISVVQPGQRVLLALPKDGASTDFGLRTLSDGTVLDAHVAGLLPIERNAFWTFMFAEPAQQPIALRQPYRDIAEATIGIPDLRLLATRDPDAGDLQRFPLAGSWWCCYDYVLVLGTHIRPDLTDPHLHLLRQHEYATLYRIQPQAEAASLPAM